MSKRRIVILTEGNTDPTPAKLASGVLRYRTDEVVALIDSTQAGRDVSELMGVGQGIPILASLTETLPLNPDQLLIGITPAGGQLPPAWRATILQAITCGLDVVSGMHTFLSDDTEIVTAAAKFGVRITDLRQVPANLIVNQCRAKAQKCFRIHTVGTDCNVGKKVVCLEMNRAMQSMGKDSKFVATGQTGIFISGQGIALDRVIGDFISGAAEQLVLENTHHEYLLIEGQGAVVHPLYSGVTLSMLHGLMPQALIIVHEYGRKIMRGSKDTPVLPPEKLIPIYEAVTEPVFPAKVVAVALNLRLLDLERARQEVDRVEQNTGLPATDVYKFGPEKLVQAVLAYEQEWRKKAENAWQISIKN